MGLRVLLLCVVVGVVECFVGVGVGGGELLGRGSTALSAFCGVVRGKTLHQMHYLLIDRAKRYEKEPGDESLLPVVTLHGGPGLPSNYLRSMEDVICKKRKLVFFDQLGCGQSDRPRDRSCYSIKQCVDDLVVLLDRLNLGDFHLYGHSFGGVLAFEYLKRERPVNCKSVVLSSAPSSIVQSNADWRRLQEEIKQSKTFYLWGPEAAFERKHLCRTMFTPKRLEESYLKANRVWGGTEHVGDYVAKIPKRKKHKIETPALLMRGEYDFVVSSNLKRWKNLMETTQTKELPNCSHHGLLENPELYGETLEAFWKSKESNLMP